MIFSNGMISKEALQAIGYRSYMSVSPESQERLIGEIDGFIAEMDGNKFLSKLENFGNPFNRVGRALAVLEYINKNESNAVLMYGFCKDWVLLMAWCNRQGYFDGRNEESVRLCCNLVSELYDVKSSDECRLLYGDRFQHCIEYSMHRTIQQSLTDCFVIGLIASAEKLGYDSVIDKLLSYFDLEDIDLVLTEVRLPLI